MPSWYDSLGLSDRRRRQSDPAFEAVFLLLLNCSSAPSSPPNMSPRDRFRREQRVAHAREPRANDKVATNESSQNGTNEKTTNADGTAGGEPYLPTHNGNTAKPTTRGIRPAGESGRRGFHPWHFIKISARSISTLSAATNVLWPFVPAAIVLHFLGGDHHVWTFATAYIGMVPAASLLGFAGSEFVSGIPQLCMNEH